MRPFASFSYIAKNRIRCAVLALMLGFTAICFMAGMYVDHPEATFELLYDKPSDYVLIYPGSNSIEIREQFLEFAENVEDYCPDTAGNIIGVGSVEISFKSIMGFENSTGMFMFRSEEDFCEFNRVMNDVPDDVVLKEGEIMLSKTLADNWGVKLGDVLLNDDDWNKAGFFVPVTVKAIVDIPGTVIYGVSEDYNSNQIMILRSEANNVQGYEKDLVNGQLEETAAKIAADYPSLKVVTNQSWMASVREQLRMITYILVAITVIIGLVLAVTVNAAFSAAFEKRKYEFSIYKALGFSKAQIFGKVAGEVLILDLIGLIAGVIICMIVILTVNYVLTPEGIFFFKVSQNGIIATLACNAMVVVPTIISSMKRIKKYDVTVY